MSQNNRDTKCMLIKNVGYLREKNLTNETNISHVIFALRNLQLRGSAIFSDLHTQTNNNKTCNVHISITNSSFLNL